jgi:hypothetical protein
MPESLLYLAQETETRVLMSTWRSVKPVRRLFTQSTRCLGARGSISGVQETKYVC